MTARKYFYLGCAIGVVVVLVMGRYMAKRINAEADVVLAGPGKEKARALAVFSAFVLEGQKGQEESGRILIHGGESGRGLGDPFKEYWYGPLPAGDWDVIRMEPVGFDPQEGEPVL